MKYGSITFTGKSGEKYLFDAWSIETRFKALAAVYFVTRRALENTTYNRASHDNIYIGQTANLADPFDTHSRFACFVKYQANCVCVHLLEEQERRNEVESDLLESHSTHCNQRQRMTRLFDLGEEVMRLRSEIVLK
jgi:hypothetical protein